MKLSKDELDLLKGVIEEIDHHLDNLDDKLILLRKEQNFQLLEEIHRVFGSIKSVASFVTLDTVKNMALKVQNNIKIILDGKKILTQDFIDLLSQVIDYLRSFVQDIRKRMNNQSRGKIEIIDLPGHEELLKALKDYDNRPAELAEDYSSTIESKEKVEINTVKVTPETEKITSEIEKEVSEKTGTDSKFYEEFFVSYCEELSENIEKLESDVLDYEKSPTEDLANSIMRTFHSIKGGTRLILSFSDYSDNKILKDIEKISHQMEDLLVNKIRSSLPLNTEIIFESIDILKHLESVLKGIENIDKSKIETFKSKIGLDVTEKYVPKAENIVGHQFSEKALKSIILQMDDFIDVMSKNNEMDINDFYRISEPVKRGLTRANNKEALKVLEKIIDEVGRKNYSSAKRNVGELLRLMGIEREIAEEKEKLEQIEQHTLIQQKESTTQKFQISPQPQFVRVEREKIEFLVNLSGEMITFKNELKYILKKLETIDRKLFIEMKSIFSKFDKLLYDLQNGTMALRMTPIGELFTRFKRTVRDLAKSMNKKVNLVTEGEEIQIDRNIVDILVDPITHMIRNAIDHGIELPQERLRLGKSEEGTVTLKAFYSGNYAVIEVEDDGKGLDPEKIRYKAIEKGLVTPDEAFKIPDEQIVYYIFEPGFSTKDVTTEISGRGIGMDVVKNIANRLGGEVILSYEKGKGTKVGVKIPLSLMVLRGLLVGVSSEQYIIPLEIVRETAKIKKNKVQKYKDAYFTNIRGEIIPIIFLEKLLLKDNLSLEMKNYRFDLLPIVVVQLEKGTFALAVDQFIEEGEYLIKNLPEEFKFSKIFTGATIMGDGSIVLIIDPNELVEN